MATLQTHLKKWRLKISKTKTVSSVFHLINRKAKRELSVELHGKLLPFFNNLKYHGITLDRSLTYRRHLESLCKKLNTQILIDYITNGWPKFKNNVKLLVRSYWNIGHELFYADGLCLKGHKIVVFECMRTAILGQLHACNLGIVKCTQKARALFYWPGIANDINDTNSKLVSCIFILLSRESDQCAIIARLGVAGHLSTTPRWGISLSAFPNGSTSKLAGLFSTLSL